MSEKECVHEFLTPMPDGYSYCHKCKASNRLTASHSPLPFVFEESDDRISSGKLWHKGGSLVCRDVQNEADMKFICLAVNSHARLVEALEKIADWYEATTSDCKECGGSKIAREALAALREGRG